MAAGAADMIVLASPIQEVSDTLGNQIGAYRGCVGGRNDCGCRTQEAASSGAATGRRAVTLPGCQYQSDPDSSVLLARTALNCTEIRCHGATSTSTVCGSASGPAMGSFPMASLNGCVGDVIVASSFPAMRPGSLSGFRAAVELSANNRLFALLRGRFCTRDRRCFGRDRRTRFMVCAPRWASAAEAVPRPSESPGVDPGAARRAGGIETRSSAMLCDLSPPVLRCGRAQDGNRARGGSDSDLC